MSIQDPYEDERDDFAFYGDARKCPRHPHVRTSSDDGMFDAPCHVCEGEEDEALRAWDEDPTNPERRYCGGETIGHAHLPRPRYRQLVSCDSVENEIPF